MNTLFKYGPPPYIISTSSRSSKNKEVIATSIPVDLVSQVLNDSIISGDVNFDNVELDLDNISGSSTNISNISVNAISSYQNAYIRVLSDIRFESKVVLSSSSFFDNNMMRVDGDVYINGTNAVFNSDQVKIKDNVIGIGINSSSIDQFVNGFYFPKKDTFTGFGLSIDKIGMMALPNGSFTANLYNIQSGSNNKRFEDDKLSMRFAYISSDYNFDINKNSEDKFSQNEINFINSLNNTSNEISNYYINIESHNITLHGGNIITGISKDLSLYLTNSNNIEIEYLKLNLQDETFDIKQNTTLGKTKFNFINSGNTIFTSNLSDTKTEIMNLDHTNNNITLHRDFKLIQNSSTKNINIYFGGDDNNKTKNTDISIYHTADNIDTEMLKIDKSNNDTNIFTSLHVEGPKLGYDGKSMYPTFTMKNSIDTISGLNTTSKSYIMSKELTANTDTNSIEFLEILTSNSKDCMVNGYIMISNATSSTDSTSHFYYKIDGMLTKGLANPIFNGFVISKSGLDLKNNITDSTIYFQYSYDYTNKSFKISIKNGTADTLRCLIKLEILSM